MAFEKINHKFDILGNIIINNDSEVEEIDISNNIKSISVDKNFIANIFPKYSITLTLPIDIYKKIRKTSIKISITVNQFNVDEDDDESSMTNHIIENEVFSNIIKVYDKSLQDVDIKDTEENDDLDNAEKRTMINLTLEGIPEALIEKNNRVINDVYNNSSMDEIVADILTKNEENEIYYDPSINKNREPTLLIPPLNISKAIQYLQENYLIYNSDYSLFFDNKYTYLIKFFEPRDIYQNKMNINVVSQNEARLEDYNDFYLDKKTNNIKKYYQSLPSPITTRDVSKYVVGGHPIIGSFGSEYELILRDYDQKNGERKVRYYWNPNGDKFNEEKEMKINSVGFNVIFKNINPELFTPTTQYLVSDSNNILLGEYYLLRESYTISSADYSNYICTGVLYLSKR